LDKATNLKSEIYLNSTLAYCEECKQNEFARITASNDGVFMQRICPVSKPEPIKLANSYHWYLERMNVAQPVHETNHKKASEKGCPNDCGLCQWHTNDILLPIFSITNDCNLDCPICFTHNRADLKYYKSKEETEKILTHVFKDRPKKQILNLTGGEPTLHPALFEIIESCKNSGVERITINTNGLKIAHNRDFAMQIKETGVQLVLSLDTLEAEKSLKIHGKDIVKEKLQALSILEELNIPTTILLVCIKEENEQEVADIVDRYIRKDFVKSITIQNMTYTGKGGSTFSPRKHITIDEVENLLASKNSFHPSDFFPLATYHPLCYSVAYYFVSNNRVLSLTKLIDSDLLSKATQDLYYMEPDNNLTKSFIDGVNNLWAEGYDDEVIMELKTLLKEIHPTDRVISNEERKKILEKHIKSIYIHSHMDSDNFDIDRVCRCGDIVPDESGRMIPACSYNLLYRKNDPRFWID
jgi:7,8-dihydro-6-hydroxymethylpterin dimethyltransferase